MDQIHTQSLYIKISRHLELQDCRFLMHKAIFSRSRRLQRPYLVNKHSTTTRCFATNNMKLWTQGSADEWTALRENLHDTLRTQGKDGLAEEEAWLFGGEFASAVKARSPPHMTKEELVRLVTWKVKLRGKFRPLIGYAEAQKVQRYVGVFACRGGSCARCVCITHNTLTHSIPSISKLKKPPNN
jgi:hypothetical protein